MDADMLLACVLDFFTPAFLRGCIKKGCDVNEITLVKRAEMHMSESQRAAVRAFLFECIDGLSETDRRSWWRFWRSLRDAAPGDVFKCFLFHMPNGRFFRRWWVLARVAFDAWADTAPVVLHEGTPVQRSFERFRKDLIVLAGFYEPVFSATGEVRLEPLSISWDSMTEGEFDELYSATIDAVLEKILFDRNLSDAEMRAWVDRAMEFA